MWHSDLLLAVMVIAVVVLAIAGVVWTDNRLHEDRSGDEGRGGAADGGTAPPRTTSRRRLPPETRGSR